MQQVITIAPGGAMSGLQRKPGQGLDLTKFGKADVRRVSEIVWDGDQQAWYVCICEGDHTTRVVEWVREHMPEHAAPAPVLRTTHWRLAGLEGAPQGSHINDIAGRCPYYFENYDDAVKAEIAFLDALRLRGIF